MASTPLRRSARRPTAQPLSSDRAHGGHVTSPTPPGPSPGPDPAANAGTQAADAWTLPVATTWSPAAEGDVVLVGADETGTLAAIDAGAAVSERLGVVLAIPEGEAVVFQGIVDVCVLEGAVSAYEHTLVPGQRWTRMYSPAAYPLITLRAASGARHSAQSRPAPGSDIAQMYGLWSKRRLAADGTRPAAVVALRAVSCGLDDIGRVAAPFRNLFTLRPLMERMGSCMPKQYKKRRLVLARIASAEKAIKLDSGADSSTGRDDMSIASDDEDDASDDEYAHAVVDYAQHEIALAHGIGLCGFNPVGRLTPDLQLLQTPSDWAEALDQASSAAVQLDGDFDPTPPVYVVAGGQGLGKSTFARLLVNRLITRFGRVFYMETDLGQPELAPPGVLSLTILDEPLLGPPFTHTGQTEPYHAVYMGVTTPKNDPDRYADAVKRLAAAYRDHTITARVAHKEAVGGVPDCARDLDAQVVPLVVNTQGWLKGLGLDLHYSLCEEVRPTNYIQVYDPAAAAGSGTAAAAAQDEFDAQSWASGNQRTPFIDFGPIAGCDPQLSWISAMGYERAMQAASTRQQQQQAAAEQPEQTTAEAPGRKGPRMTAHDTRMLAVLSHLYSSSDSIEPQAWNTCLWRSASMSWSVDVPLASRFPLVVPWADLVVWLGEEDIPPSQVLRALNGSLVGVIAIAAAPGPDAHVWTQTGVRSLYADDGSGIGDHAALELSGPGARALLRSTVSEHQAAHTEGFPGGMRPPQLVYGHPNTSTTTFVAHALVRSVDASRGLLHLLLPPLVAGPVASEAHAGVSSLERSLRSPLSRIVGIAKGPGTGNVGIELPVWTMVDGGYAERAMGSGRQHARPQSATLGIQEAPYISVELDEGIGASSSRSWGGLARRALQG
ncbi:Polynucleotide 5'-hydroxyl-kinase grc3 [Coemansia spiralis]|nr:Polynucleotide 5'-hydroxyl-kinase grc3 [Coemansia spiralis]